MYEIKVDKVKNLLVIRGQGYISDDQIKFGTDEIIAAVKQFKKGFTVINDISEMESTSEVAAQEFIRAQSAILRSGVGKVIRVVGNKISKTQMSNASDRVGYTALEASSLDEAYELVRL